MTILADYFFLYLIIPKNPPVSILIKLITDFIDWKQDLFIYITTEYYISKEFYSVIINISTSKKSTTSYRQYLIYKSTITNNININTI
jgi:hypothetical protein